VVKGRHCRDSPREPGDLKKREKGLRRNIAGLNYAAKFGDVVERENKGKKSVQGGG